MKRGQIFSIDFVLATVLVIFFIGVTMGLADYQTYSSKEVIEKNNLHSTVEAASISLLNGKYSCELNGVILSNTIDESKLTDTPEAFAQYLGLQDKNFQILLEGSPIASNLNTFGDNVISHEFDVASCNNNLNEFRDINDCLISANCIFIEKRLILMVSE